MHLNFSLNFSDLNSPQGLQKVDQVFLNYLGERNPTLHKDLLDRRLSQLSNSDFLINLAPYLDDFIAELFFIESENLALKILQHEFDIIYECRRKFVQRVVKNFKTSSNDQAKALELSEEDGRSYLPHNDNNFAIVSRTLTALLGRITEKNFAENVLNWLQEPQKFQIELDTAAAYACYMVENNSSLALFNIPRVNEDNKIRGWRVEMLARNPYIGFDYRDHEASIENALAQAKYCIYCHNQKKDSCRTGSGVLEDPEEKNGCPLDQKISEMNKLFASGFNIGALSVTVIDNPLVASTGHRICNDCMKACIFQKQDPVNIPLVESKILDNVLSMPHGVEIYLLLTKWNPLNVSAPLPLDLTGYNVLVVGLGPAGFALSHYLLNQGHSVTAIDGLKIQNIGFDVKEPIKDWQKFKIPLSERLPQGFGGVAEYGITNRWDKNNLILVRLMLERRSNFKMMGGIRLGSNFSLSQAFELGFDHIALCLGAGKPRYINSDSYFLKGVKSAADFLMNLQQGGSYLQGSNSKLLIRMPAVIIGLGLTAVDSAVEIIHYYPVQVEKFLCAYEQGLVNLADLNKEDKIIAREFITHGKFFRQAVTAREKLRILEKLGGVSICYRNIIAESPAYKRNHEEIEHAMALGVKFVENISPLEVTSDEYHWAKGIRFRGLEEQVAEMKARTVLVAIGTEEVEENYPQSNMNITRFGDYDPKYSGSVVKALASAKNGYKDITAQLSKYAPKTSFVNLSKALDKQLRAYIYHTKEISPEVIELIIKSPLAAGNYKPGQTFRLQNLAKSPEKTMKPIALSPYKVDVEEGLIHFLITKIGNSTKLCAQLKIREEVVLMGPSGSHTNILPLKKVALIGYGLRNMALIPIAKAFKNQGSEVIFWANYAKEADIIYPDKIKKAAQEVVWSIGELTLPEKNDAQAVIIAYVPPHILPKIKEKLPDSSLRANLLSPMQCMMQGICGQCIQKVDDQAYVFACACLEYDIKKFNPQILLNRLQQNSLLERI